MTNMPKLSARARKALDALANGGRFVKRLERNSYTGREEFKTRLLLNGHSMRGYGEKTFYELQDAGMIALAGGGTSVSTYYKLATA